MLKLFILLGLCLFLIKCDVTDVSDYNKKRAKLLRDELHMTVGGNTTLSEKEMVFNNCLMRYKFRELDYGFKHPDNFNLSQHYFTYKSKLKDSKVYQMLQKMPKGAALHLHDVALLKADYLVNLTYTPNLYMCFSRDNLLFKFSNTTPKISCSNKWKNVAEVRKSSSNITEFDAQLRKFFTIVVDNPDIVYPTIKESWIAFMNYFNTVYSLITYRPIWEQYFYDALEKFREDNVMYVEVRSMMPQLYELDGTVYDPVITAKAYQKMANKFIKDYPDFIGAKVIYAPLRLVNSTTIEMYLQLARNIKNEVSDFFAGFDLVGQEDLGTPLINFVPILLPASNEFHYFFHAGETDWYGSKTDENLLDAVMLGAKRIGHAYALAKHPLLMKKVVEDDICLEINVISNTVLSLVRDVRNHPLSLLLANDMPIVISSDDPGAWEAEPLTDDFYVAFMGAASKHSDLRLLKKLALNSLQCSTLGDRKSIAIEHFNRKWNDFINNFKCSNY